VSAKVQAEAAVTQAWRQTSAPSPFPPLPSPSPIIIIRNENYSPLSEPGSLELLSEICLGIFSSSGAVLEYVGGMLGRIRGHLRHIGGAILGHYWNAIGTAHRQRHKWNGMEIEPWLSYG